MRKKLFLMLAIGVVLALCLCACGKDKGKTDSELKEKDKAGNYTEYGVIKELENRGFELPIMTSSAEDLDTYIPSTVEEDSDEKHLLYFTNYMGKNHEEWVIYVLGKDIFASPVSFNTENGEDYVVVESSSISEKLSNSGTSSELVSKLDTNHENYIFVKVEKVDAKTLDKLDYQTLKKHEKN